MRYELLWTIMNKRVNEINTHMLWLIIIQVRKKVSTTSQQPPTLYYDNKTHFTSEPYLMDESETLHQPVRRGSQRRPAQNNVSSNASGRKSTFFFPSSLLSFPFNSVSWFSILLNIHTYWVPDCVSTICMCTQVQHSIYLIHSFFSLSCTYSTSKVKYIFRCSRSKF